MSQDQVPDPEIFTFNELIKNHLKKERTVMSLCVSFWGASRARQCFRFPARAARFVRSTRICRCSDRRRSDGVVADLLSGWRFYAILLGVFGALALLIAAIGV